MPGWNLVDARSLFIKNSLRWSLTASLAILMVAAAGCTKFSPGSLQEIFNSQPDAWHTEPAAPDEFYLAPDAQEALDSLHQQQNSDGEAKASIVLPEIDPAEIAAMNDGHFEINTQEDEVVPESKTHSTDQTNADANLVVDELVPAPEIFGQPLRPLTFDHQSRKRIDDEVGSLRRENVIKLIAEPSGETLHTPNPVAELVEPSTIANNREPSLPPLEIVDARYLPNSKNRVELPKLPLEGAQPVKSNNWDARIEPQFESTTGGQVLLPIVLSEESLPASQPESQIVERIPPFADHPELDASQSSFDSARVTKTQPDENTTNDFELPTSQQPPKVNLESITGDDSNSGPVKRIDAHASQEQQSAEFASPFRALTLRGAVVGSATAFATPVQPALAHEPAPTNEPEPSSAKTTDTQLRLANASFCSSVTGYGQFDPFEQNRFGPNQRLLVYCEIENFVSVEDNVNNEKKFKTKLRGSYRILAADGSTIDMYEFPIVEDIARNQRRDFYVHLPVHLGNLPTGTYSIQLNIDDLNGNSSANLTNPIEFDVIQ